MWISIVVIQKPIPKDKLNIVLVAYELDCVGTVRIEPDSTVDIPKA